LGRGESSVSVLPVARPSTKVLQLCTNHFVWVVCVEDYDVDVRNIRNGVVDITNNVVVKCCK